MEAKRLEKYRRRLYSDAPLIGGWLRRKAVESLMKNGSPEAVRALEEAAPRNGDEAQFEIVAALRQLTEQGNAEAQGSLCRLVIFHDLLLAREAALALPCAPRDASQRALFYFLTEQWDKYESLDFDHSLMRAAYEAADEKLRQRIGERARRAGRVEWVEVAAGGRQGRRLGEMTDREWEVALEVLSGSGRWAEMWRLAQEAPARWSARLLQRVSSAGWVPDGDSERVRYEELTILAERWTDAWLGSLLQCRAALEGHESYVACLAISPDGWTLASGSTDKAVRLWSLPNGAPLKMLEEHEKTVKCLAISPDGRVLASGSVDHTVRLWSLPDGALLKTMKGHRNAVWCLAISTDGRMLASGSWDNTVRLWRLPDGASLKTLKGHSDTVRCLAISFDGRVLASGSWHNTVRLWGLPDGALLKTLEGHESYFNCLATSPDGRVLASGSVDHTVRLWSLPDGAPLKTLKGHTDMVWCLAVSPDGRMLASGGTDKTVRLWSLPDGAPLKTLEGHTERVSSLAISRDGQILASGSFDHTVRLWTLDPFSRLPIGQTNLEDLALVQETLHDGNLSAEERNCLEFIVALMRWRRQFDIEVGEALRRIEIGEFDIEIEG